MSSVSGHVFISPVASSVPFNNTTGKGYGNTNVQTILEELRDCTVYVSSTTATTASGTLVLTPSSRTLEYLTGSAAGFSVQLPDATLLVNGQFFQVANTSSQPVSIKDAGSNTLFTLAQNSIALIYLQLNTSSNGTWISTQSTINSSTASGIVNYTLTSSTPFSTTSTTDVVITGFTITPQAGTYACWYSADILYNNSPRTNWVSFYKGGTLIADSTRQQRTSAANQVMQEQTITTTSFNGSQAMDVRVRCDAAGGQKTVNARSMILIRLGT